MTNERLSYRLTAPYSSKTHQEPDELPEATLEKNSNTLFATEFSWSCGSPLRMKITRSGRARLQSSAGETHLHSSIGVSGLFALCCACSPSGCIGRASAAS